MLVVVEVEVAEQVLLLVVLEVAAVGLKIPQQAQLELQILAVAVEAVELLVMVEMAVQA
jgi:hypothetical protein